ncbi:MAG: hypothetical protein ABI333_00590 [bacterium]
MEHLLLPIVFLLGALGGGALIWRRRGRRGADEGAEGGLGRWPKVKLVAATAVLTTLLLGALGYGLVRHRFKKTQASGASVRQAVSDFRKTGSSAAKQLGKSPAGGVYRYAATGFYEVEAPVLGKDRRVMPKTVPAVLVPDGDCWELTIRYFKQHHWTARYCRGPQGGLRFVWAKNKNEFFSMKNRSHTFCTPNVILRPGGLPGPGPDSAPGTEWKEVCKRKMPKAHQNKADVDITIRYVGVESVTVGKRAVLAHHLRSSFSMKGMMSGTFQQDFWYAKSSGLLIKLRTKGRASGMGKFVSDYQLTLQSLSPTR